MASDSFEALQWLQLYRKLTAKQAEGLSDLEQKQLAEVERKITKFIEPATSEGPPRRAHLRAPTKIEIIVKSAGDMQRLFIKNISGGGMYVESPIPQPVGTKFELDLALPNFKKVAQVTVEVAWTQTKRVGDLEPGMGVKFVHLPQEIKAKIQELVTAKVEEEIKARS